MLCEMSTAHCVQAKLGGCERKLEKEFHNVELHNWSSRDNADVQGKTPVGKPSCRWEDSVK